MHPIDGLFEKLRTAITEYPAGVVVPPRRIRGLAFFPGGSGMWKHSPNEDHPPMPVGGTMVVGHNLDSLEAFTRSAKKDQENRDGPTWLGVRELLGEEHLSECFFTNFFMGLKAEGSALGKFPGSSSADFVRRCSDFWIEQLRVQQPSLVIALGAHVPRLLARAAQDLRPWAAATTLAELDEAGTALIERVEVPGLPPFAAVAMTHPSYRRLHVVHRRFRDQQGEAAERALLEESRRAASALLAARG